MGAIADALVNSGLKQAQALIIEKGLGANGARPNLAEFQEALVRAGVDHHSASILASTILSSVPGDGIPFASFPTAAAAGLGALQWESAFGILLRSDGTYWRPAGGHQMLRNLAADWVMSTPGSALQVCDSFDIPAGMLPPGAALGAVVGFDKLGGTSDTLTVRLKLGGTSVVLPALASTSVSAGTLQRFKRVSATTVQRVGGGNAAAIGPLSSTSTSARPAAITVADLDANALTVELSGQMTTGSTEYGVIHHYTLSLVG